MMRWRLVAVVVLVNLIACVVHAADLPTLWRKKCQACHGADGRGNARMARVLMVEPERLNVARPEVRAKSDAELLRVIHKGRGRMPGFANQLGRKKQEALLGYLRTLAASPH